MRNKYNTIILMGIQGSGKGTQGQLMKERLGFEFLEAGGMFRNEIESGSDLGKKVDEIINEKGELVPDEITKRLIEKQISQIEEDKTIVLDGYPRTLIQFNDLKEILAKIGRENIIVFDIKISDDEALKRLSSRKLCQDCKTIYRGEDLTDCEKCGGKLVRRKDDTPEKIKTRLSWSHSETDPVIEEYRKSGNLIEIDGARDIEIVYKDIEKYLE